MPIKLDHVGLNTLIQEPVEEASQNTIGYPSEDPVANYVNTEVSSISNGDYLVALNIHRNGPYGWPIFKQTRIGQNPLTRLHNRTSVFTYITEVGEVKLLKADGKYIGSVRETSDIKSVIESPVVSNYKPLTLIGSTKVESTRGGILSKQRIEIKTSFSNETTYFADEQATRDHGVDLETVENYEDFIDLYLDGGLDSDDSPFDEFEMLRTEQTIFPAPGNMYMGQVRSREEFVNKFWRTDRTDRTQLDVDTGFGVTVHSQSMWPLDAVENHTTFMTVPELPIGIDGDSVVFAESYISSPPGGTSGGAGILQSGLGTFYGRKNAATPSYSAPPVYYNVSASLRQSGIQHSFTRTHLSGSGANTVYGNEFSGRLYGKAKWQAAEMSGKTPFYDSYKSYHEEIRNLGSNFSLIPEFKISDHIEDVLKNGKDSELYINPLLSLTGAQSTKNDSSKPSFFKTYSTSDFLQNFEIIQEDHKGFVNPLSLKLKCKAIKKFLPYENFYPCQQTVDISRVFYSAIKNNTTSSAQADGTLTDSANPYMNTLFSPGCLYNTIKSGIAVGNKIYSSYPDYRPLELYDPEHVYHGGKGVGDIYSTCYVNKNRLNEEIPFEALVEPERHLSKRALAAQGYGYTTHNIMSASWTGEGDLLEYKLKINNFLSETADFFLENKNFTTITSLPEGDPNFGNCEIGKTYMMRISMNRSVSGSKDVLVRNNITYQAPQDDENVIETFTMYSNPQSFGESNFFILEDGNEYEFENFKQYKNINIPSFSYHTGTIKGDGSTTSDAVLNALVQAIDGANTFKSYLPQGHIQIGSNPQIGENFPHTPPYYHGEAWADITFVATKEKHTISDIISNSSTEFYRYYNHPVAYPGSPPSTGGHKISGSIASALFGQTHLDCSFSHYRLINEEAMQLPSSVNLFSKGILSSDPAATGFLGDQYRWIIQSKFETPHLNFNHISHSDIELPLWGPESTPIGMWHQYGLIPSSSEGVFLKVSSIPRNWINGAMSGDYLLTGSLSDLCGFSNEPVKMGQIKESKIIKEAVVAIPFIEREGERKFFTLDKKDIKHALQKETQNLAGQTVLDQVQRMQEYIFPPSMDFIRNKDIEPFAMYIFEFSHTLSKQNLADIWQNLSPDIGTSHEVSEATISHQLLSHELLGDGAKLKFTTSLELEKKQRIKEIPSDIRWMVFKVKKRAASNYFEKIYERNESNLWDQEKLDELSVTSTGANTGVQHNWPYDYFSLVELVKIDAQVDFAIPDDDNEEEKLVIKTIKKKTMVDTTPTENDAVINNALFGTGTPLTSPAEESPALEPEEPTPLGNVDRSGR